MLTWSEVWRYITRVLRWWPLLLTAVALASGTTWYLLRQEEDFYASKVSLLVGDNFTSTAPDRTSVDLSNVVAEYYAEIIRRELILLPVTERLGLEFPWTYIRDYMLSTSINRSANLLEITVVDANPERAAAIAGAIADELMNFSPNSPERRNVRRVAIDRQISENQVLLSDLNQKIEVLEQKQASVDSSMDVRTLSDQLEKLRAQRKDLQAIYSQLLLQRESEAANNLAIFEPPRVPTDALPKKTLLTVAVAAIGGFIFAILAVLVIEKFDTRWRTPADLQERLGTKWLGQAAYGQPAAFTKGLPPSGVEQNVAGIFTNLILAAKDQVPRALLISSPEPNPLRSAFTVDLAYQYALAGNRVLIVDAEPSTTCISDLFGSQSSRPMIVLREHPGPWESDASWVHGQPGDLYPHLQPTVLANVLLLPGPRRRGDMTQALVPSLRWPEYVRMLRQTADVVIFDGPSAMTGADAALLASEVDGIVLALDPRRDSRAIVDETRGRLLNNGAARLLGAVTVLKASGRGWVTSSRRAGFAISVDRSGITISLPKGRSAEVPRAAASHAEPAAGDPNAEPAPVEGAITRAVGEKYSWEELVSLTRQQANGENRGS